MIQFYNEWVQLFGKFNWRTFNLINIEVEREDMLGLWNFDFCLLGFGVHFSITYNPEPLRKIEDECKEIKSNPEKNLVEMLPIMSAPYGWRYGQFIFNFLEWLKDKGYDGGQSNRLADTFHIPNEEFEKLLEEYEKTL